jgi:hypothetical protein
MTIPKQYFQDRFILLVLSSNVFLVFLTLLFLIFRIGSGHSTYIVQYRQNLGADAFTAGSLWQLLSFGLFAIFVVGFNLFLSMRMYQIHRQLSVVALGMATVLLLFGLVVSNALLILR